MCVHNNKVCVCVCARARAHRAKDALGSSLRSSTGSTGGSRPAEGLAQDGGLDEDENGGVEVGSGWDVRGFEVGGAPEGWVVQVTYCFLLLLLLALFLLLYVSY